MTTRRHPAAVLLALASPIGLPALALWLHQSDIVTLPWNGGITAIVVLLIAGFLCGFLWRSGRALAYLTALWALWATIAIMADILGHDYGDPGVVAAVVASIFLALAPALVAGAVGVGLGKWAIGA